MPATSVTGVSPLGLFRTIPLGTYVYCVNSTGVLPGLEEVVEVHGRVPQIVSDKSISLIPYLRRFTLIADICTFLNSSPFSGRILSPPMSGSRLASSTQCD